MTTEELEAAMKQAHEDIDKHLQMPPVVKKRTPITGILSKDPALQGYESSKHVFIDITYGLSLVDRLIAVRDADGLLRHANWDERFRMNQIYNPILGREIHPPKMFLHEYLQVIKFFFYLFIFRLI